MRYYLGLTRQGKLQSEVLQQDAASKSTELRLMNELEIKADQQLQAEQRHERQMEDLEATIEVSVLFLAPTNRP